MSETASPEHPAARHLPGGWAALLGAALLAGYGAFLVRHAAFAVGGADSSGYANTARRMKAGTLVDRPRSLDRLGLSDDMARICIPLGFLTGPKPGTMAPAYPSGFPAHLLAASMLAGWEVGPYLVSPLAAVLSVLLLYLLGRDLGLSASWAGGAAAIFAVWPVLVFQAFQPMSDVVATLWAIAAMLFARRARRHGMWALAAGGAFGLAVLVRPANVLLLVPLAFALPATLSTFALFAAGGVPFAAAFAAYNLHCYGGVLKTGYGKIGLFDSLKLSNFAPRIKYYGLQILQTFSPLPPLAWLALPADRRTETRDRAMLLTWFGTYLLLFSFYGPYESFIFVRFLLPGVPALVLGAALVAHRLLGDSSARRLVLAAVLFLSILALEVRSARHLDILGIIDDQSVYPEACRWASSVLPAPAVVLTMPASGALEYYTDLTYVVWVWVDAESFRALRPRTERRGWRWFALLFPDEREGFFKQLPGRWIQIGQKRSVTLWKLEP
ncbi:MAG TPA: hypothetical protein VK780_03185 [Thermoanaerobaculia bacterium]|nr:hypothetical protein [Thermoanaerobaculia bacterium]